ncbi:family 43 glycosylhydrolase [Microbacterium sp. 22215]|uniref:family 43 glycosylhydrolase n=1 Tax=Microbacterium sp. 22215 TaxID=3453893 RepID=UPI003F86F05A
MTTAPPDFTSPSPVPGFYADPALLRVGDRYWLYPTTDGIAGWGATSFSAFSSSDLATWTPAGEVLRLGREVGWATEKAWAPAIAERDGSFFLYYTAGGNSIGVARASRPDGPFQDLGRPLISPDDYDGVAIDPSVFQDDDGTWYLLWGNGVAHIAALNDDMMSFARDKVADWVPTGFREAITIHRRGGVYYATWSENDTRDPEYRVRYATGASPHGPWLDRGVLIQAEPELGYLGTGHHCVLEVSEDEWIVAYHRFAIAGGSGHQREVVFDELLHHDDGRLEVIRRAGGFRRDLDPQSSTRLVVGIGAGDLPAAQRYALHLAIRKDGDQHHLRSGGGIAYATSELAADGRQTMQTLTDPVALRVADSYVIAAVPRDSAGRELLDDALLLARTQEWDDIVFQRIELGTRAGVHDLRVGVVGGQPTLTWRDDAGILASRLLTDEDEWTVSPTVQHVTDQAELHVLAKEARQLITRLEPVQSVSVQVEAPANASRDAILASGARIHYSDGSARRADVTWDAADLDALSTPGVHHVRGRVDILDLPFPFVEGRADPVLFSYCGRWYLIATDEDDRGDDYGLLIREATRIRDLAEAPDHKILGTGSAGIDGCFWAPELHLIGGHVRVLFAPSLGTGDWRSVQCHIMTLRAGGDLTVAADWSAPEPVRNRHGQPLQISADLPGISLDMTYFEAEERSYYLWSQRSIVGDLAGDAELWIAEVDPAKPAQLKSDAARIYSGSYSWELTDTNVVEGPYALIRNSRIHLAYAAAAVGPDYATGFLTADVGEDLLDPASWEPQPYPALDTRSVPGEFGPGHVSFVRAGEDTLIAFHALSDRSETRRATGIRRVHWRADGRPDLAVTPERDLAPHLRDVVLEVHVDGEQ